MSGRPEHTWFYDTDQRFSQSEADDLRDRSDQRGGGRIVETTDHRQVSRAQVLLQYLLAVAEP